MSTAARANTGVTAQEFWERRDEFKGCELVDGEVVEVSPTKKRHGRSECRIAFELERHFDAMPESDADVVTGEVGYRLGEGVVRAADAAVHLHAMKEDDVDGWHAIAPDIVVEVVPPNDTWPNVERKIDDWHTLGVQEVWTADPKHTRLKIRRLGKPCVTFDAEAKVETPLLPGFSVPTWRLFKRRR
ncbi:MAG: Uma2 family endonuclease [Myxococcales bacterium]|nr:Uma2 family endonuclease [Myxococcales bacterium]